MVVYYTFYQRIKLKKFLFIDLDDTLFQTIGKCAQGYDLHPAAYLKDGSACSFMTKRQLAFFDLMRGEMTLIPATARNQDALSRVDLPFTSYSIINYGGVILEPGGMVNNTWLEIMRGDMESAQDGLKSLIQIIDEYSDRKGLKGRARLIEDFSIPFYIVVKDPNKIIENLELLERDIVLPWINTVGKEYFIHRNGNNLAVLPKTLNKARAVAYLRKQLESEYGDIMTIGMGDSRSDARFMSECDYAIIPSGTQLASQIMALI